MTSRLCFAAAVTAALFVALPGAAFADTTPPAPVPTGTSSSGPVQSQAPTTPPAPAGPATTVAPVPAAPAPAPGQVGVVPVGAADTGGGSTAPGSAGTLFVLGGLGLAGATGAGALVVARRRTA